MKRALTATATGIALLAGGVLTAAPAMAFDTDTIGISATNPGGRELQVNALVWCSGENGYAKFAQTLGANDSRGMTPSCDLDWTDRAYPNIALGTPEMFAANKPIICDFIITGSPGRNIQFTVVPFAEAFAYAELGNTTAYLCHAGEKDAKNYVTLDQPANSTYNVIVTSAKADGSGYVWDDYYANMNAANTSSVAAAADVEASSPLGAAAPDDEGLDPLGTSPDDAPDDDSDDLGGANLTTTRSKTLTTSAHRVSAKHHTRVEKMAAKVHNKGGVLTIHAYGPDEDLALARARAVRAHLEAQLAKRGHTESSPIWVTYAGDPDHKKNTHVTVHWHPDTSLPGALPGVK